MTSMTSAPSKIARRICSEICPFCGLTELKRSSLSNRSSKMFTLSAICQATAAFLAQRPAGLDKEDEELALEFWTTLGEMIRGWGFIGDGRTPAGLRRDYLHVHALALHALGMVAGELASAHPLDWQLRFRRLSKLDWRRTNPLWQGRAIRDGRIITSNESLVLTANVLRIEVGIELAPSASTFENTWRGETRVAA